MKAPAIAMSMGLAVAVVVSVSACTGDSTTDFGALSPPSGRTGPPSPGARSTGPATPVHIPYVDGTERKAKPFQELRAIDPCALLDPAAAARVTHDTADSLLPDEHLGACRLDMSKSRWELTWQLSVEVGEKYDPDVAIEQGRATAETIKGVEFYREKSMFESELCTYVRPMENGYSIEFTASLGITKSSMAPCDVAAHYLEQTATRWRQLPRRGDKLTEPRLPLADRDPCEATTAVGEALDRSVRADPSGPYECVLTADRNDEPGDNPSAGPSGGPGAGGGGSSVEMSGDADIRITYTLDRDPAAISASTPTSRESITVDGHAATQRQLDGVGCTVDVAVNRAKDSDKNSDKNSENDRDTNRDGGRDSDRVMVQGEDDSQYVEIVSVQVASCEDATRAATAVIKQLT